MKIHIVTKQSTKDHVAKNVYWDNWGTTSSYTILAAFSVKPEIYETGLEISSFALPVRSASLYGLVIQYSHLDSFGSDTGLGEILWAFSSAQDARSAMQDALEQIKSANKRRPLSFSLELEMEDGTLHRKNIQNPACNGRDYIDAVYVCVIPFIA